MNARRRVRVETLIDEATSLDRRAHGMQVSDAWSFRQAEITALRDLAKAARKLACETARVEHPNQIEGALRR